MIVAYGTILSDVKGIQAVRADKEERRCCAQLSEQATSIRNKHYDLNSKIVSIEVMVNAEWAVEKYLVVV